MAGVIIYYRAVSELLCFPCVLLGWWHLHSPGPGTMFEDKSERINPKVTRRGIHLIKYRRLNYTSVTISSLCSQKWKVSTSVVCVKQLFHVVRGILSWKDCREGATRSETDICAAAIISGSARWIPAGGSLPEPCSEDKKPACFVLELHMHLSLPVICWDYLLANPG